MDIVQTTILEAGINNTLRPEIVLATTNVKNLGPTRAFKDSMSPIEMQNQALPTFQHLRNSSIKKSKTSNQLSGKQERSKQASGF